MPSGLYTLQSGSKDTSGVASVASSSAGSVTTPSYSSYNTNVWTGNTGTSYNMGAYDMNSLYNSYAQMYGQYYANQVVLLF